METVSIHDLHREIFPHTDSPAFEAPFPKLVNADLIPDNIMNAMAPGWRTHSFGPRPVHVVRLYDVYVTGEGLVFDSRMRLVTESITQHTEPELQKARQRVLTKPPSRTEWGQVVLLRKRGDSNYGHWMVELLPKLWAAADCGALNGCAVPKKSGAMKQVMQTAIARSTESYPLLELSDEEVIFFKQLIFVEGLTYHGVYMSPLAFSRTERMAGSAGGTRKLFVSRRDTPRTLSNEDDVESALQREGFDIVYPGKMSFEEQMQSFANASHVVGVMGAGMTNTMFCAPGAKVVNLAPATMPDTFFYFIGVHRKLDYTEIRGQNMRPSQGWDEPFHISPKQILECLA